MNWSTTFQPSKIGEFFKFWWGLGARERNASSNWMDPQENEKKKSKKLKFLKRCTQKVQLSKAATEVPGAPPHCTSVSVFQTTSIIFFLHLMKISLQLHTLFLNSWVRTFAKIENKNLTSNLTQNRVQPPKTSPIEQISYRCEPKISPLRRVTLQ